MNQEKWNERYARRDLVWSAAPNATVADEARDLRPGRGLDLGCGEGRNALWLAAQGWTMTAIDFSDVAIARAQRLATEQGVEVDWRVGDVAELSLESNYDLVLVAFLHTPASERHRWMEQARNALRPGGTFLYVGHDLSNLEHGRGGPQNPEVLCTPADIVADLPGFRVSKAEVIKRAVGAESGHGGEPAGLALDTLVRAVKA